MNVLFVKLGAIGDIVHTLPALSAVRRALPEAHISWAAERRSAEVLRGNPLIDDLIEVDTRSLRRKQPADELVRGLRAQARGLRSRKYDIAIDFQGLLKSAVIAKLSGARRRYGFGKRALREPSSRFMLTDLIDVPAGLHVIRKNLALASGAVRADLSAAVLEFPIATSHDHVLEAERAAASVAGEFAILNPGGGWVTKLWPAERFGELAAMLWSRHRIASLITAGPGEEDLAERVASAAGGARTAIAHVSLKGFYELARRARLYVGGDTGPTHLAVAAGAPIVGIFGPTEWWRNGSPDPRDICVERTDIGCRADCHRRNCAEWICMDIPASAVLRAAEARLGIVSPTHAELRA